MRSCRGFSNEPIWTGPPPQAPTALLWLAIFLFALALLFVNWHR